MAAAMQVSKERLPRLGEAEQGPHLGMDNMPAPSMHCNPSSKWVKGGCSQAIMGGERTACAQPHAACGSMHAAQCIMTWQDRPRCHAKVKAGYRTDPKQN